MYESVYRSLCLLLLQTASLVTGNEHRHQHRTRGDNHSLAYLDMMVLEDAKAICGMGCYRISRSKIPRNIADIFRVDVQFKESGISSQSSEDEYQNDIFVVERQRPYTLLQTFNVSIYEFYRKGLRPARDLSDILRWLNDPSQGEYFYLKCSKRGDIGNLRFVFNPNSKPALIMHSHSAATDARVRRSATRRCPNADVNSNTCCLADVAVTDENQGSGLVFLEIPANFSVAVCLGQCLVTPHRSTLQRWVEGNYGKCCLRQGVLGYVRLKYIDGVEERESDFALNARACHCTSGT